ncbi:MAG TPA: NADH-quinone oxidoreductase subunit A [Bryobacteraceae bacterium]|nr:NADH-quinone oxidoreductase subunit A [Bryobacteraceae bacterium]
MAPLWPLALYFVLVIGAVAATLIVSSLLGQRHRDHATDDVYEGGVIPIGSARVRLSVRFYLVAMLFVIFDLEAVFLFAWAIAARELGWYGYSVMALFVVLLIAAFGYLWRVGAFDWAVIRRNTE